MVKLRITNTFSGICGTLLVIATLLLMGCPTPPEFNNIPAISYKSIAFEVRTEPDQPNIVNDVISLEINFEDGDGNLGLSTDEQFAPYDPFTIPLNGEGELRFIGSEAGLPEFNPLDYFVVQEGDTALVLGKFQVTNDTFLIERNPRFYNIFIRTFYRSPKTNEFVEFVWEDAPYYQTFSGRFPILNTEEYERPITGNLTYELKSSGFRAVFKNYDVVIEAYILDRDGNQSNTVRSESIQLIK